MLKKKIRDILTAAKPQGWVLEPDAKRLLALAGLPIPKFQWAKRPADAVKAAETIGYPVVGKVVSPKILHKSDAGGIVVGIDDAVKLKQVFNRFREMGGFAGMLIEETLSGVELIVGAKVDYQFGPIILLGIGGTGVEVYHDTSIRMAPIVQSNVDSMVKSLRAHQLIEGYRGSVPVNLEKLSQLLVTFSDLVMALETRFESIDLNPVMCSKKDCVVADARIMLAVAHEGMNNGEYEKLHSEL